MAELLGCDLGCVPFFYVVYRAVSLYFVVVDFKYFWALFEGWGYGGGYRLCVN